MQTPPSRLRALALLLAIACALAFAPALLNGFVAYDDDVYVYSNPLVCQGLTWEGLRWAFTTQHAGNWHPLTWLSHMLDVELFGLSPAGHHASSLVLHVLATWALLAALAHAGLALGASAFVAAVFALHPTRVESVAWIAERKDVLCALFWFLALGAWSRWSRARGGKWFALTLACHALAVMAKPMAVTLPLTLLLFDHWPLRRTGVRGSFAMLLEKAPFFALSGLSSVLTWRAQSAGGALSGVDVITLAERTSNALASFAIYLGRWVWPFDLAVLYPFPFGGAPPHEVVLGVAALALGASAAWVWRRSRPAIGVGFAWFALTLVPVIGIVQVGLQANADRYTYVPYVGLAFMVVGALEGLAVRNARLVHAGFALVSLAWLALTFGQTRAWRDTPTLFRRALAVTQDNFIAHNNLGMALLESGAVPEAILELESCVRVRPDYYRGQSNLASAYVQAGRLADAERVYRGWIATHGDDAGMLANLATVEMQLGRYDDARGTLRRALELDVDRRTYARERWIDLALLAGDFGGAASALEAELALRPGDAALAARLAAARALAADPRCGTPECRALRGELAGLEREVAGLLLGLDRGAEALVRARRAVELAPDDPDAQADLGVIATRVEDLALAAASFERALELAPSRAELHNNLGFVRYRQGALELARDAFREALRLAPGYAEARRNLDAVERALAER